MKHVACLPLVAALCLCGSGCSSMLNPPCKEVVWLGTPERFDKKNPPRDVETAINLANEFLEESRSRLYPTMTDWVGAWCLAEESEKYFRYILEEAEPHNAYAEVSMGYLDLMRAQLVVSDSDMNVLLSSALAHFKSALEKRRGYVLAHIYMGEYHCLREDWSSATAEYQTLLDSGIEDSYIHAWWGYALVKSGNKSGAREHWQRAVELSDPEKASTWASEQL